MIESILIKGFQFSNWKSFRMVKLSRAFFIMWGAFLGEERIETQNQTKGPNQNIKICFRWWPSYFKVSKIIFFGAFISIILRLWVSCDDMIKGLRAILWRTFRFELLSAFGICLAMKTFSSANAWSGLMSNCWLRLYISKAFKNELLIELYFQVEINKRVIRYLILFWDK